MLTTSIPERVRCADSNSLNPVIILIRLFILRWSCSMILFKYLTFRIFIFFVLKLLLFTVKIAELLDPLLSMFTILGLPLLPIALLKNFCADIFCLRLVNKKSTVFQYISLPFTLIYVSSIRQLSQTCFFRLCILLSTSLENLNTHLWIVEWSTFIPLIDINSSTSL